jgi:hypothetical protein
MRLIADPDTVRRTRRRGHSAGNDFWITAYMGTNRYDPAAAPPPTDGALYPMAFLVEQDPGCVAPAHFHQADQFQVVVHGAGQLGTHDVAPVTVHFTGKWSPYGPLVAGPAGLHYFTLRNGWDPGARYMREERAALRAIPGRRHREAVSSPAPIGSDPGGAACIAPAEDGLTALRFRLPAGGSAAGPDPAGGRGQYWVVLAGGLRVEEAELGPLGCLFLSPDEPAFTAVAGSQGAELLALQFPRAAG